MTAPTPDTALRVLVVEDDPALCELACLWIESLRGEAVGATSPQEALEILAGATFDVLFSDYVMPGPMNGLDLATVATRRHPSMRVVMTSGDASLLAGAPLSALTILPKPYSRSALAAALMPDHPGP